MVITIMAIRMMIKSPNSGFGQLTLLSTIIARLFTFDVNMGFLDQMCIIIFK